MAEQNDTRMEKEHKIMPKKILADDGQSFSSFFGSSAGDQDVTSADQQATLNRDVAQHPTRIPRYPTPSSPEDQTPCPSETILRDQLLTSHQGLGNIERQDAIPFTSPIERHSSEQSPEFKHPPPSDQPMGLDDKQEAQFETKQNTAQKRPYVEDQALPQHSKLHEHNEKDGEATTSIQDQEPLSFGPIEPPMKKQKMGPPSYPCGKDAGEQAIVRHNKKHDLLKEHIRKQILTLGYNLSVEDVTPPPPIRRRKIKQLSGESDDSDDPVDLGAPGPEIQQIKAKDRVKEIGGAIISGGGLTNRRTGSQKDDLKYAKTAFGFGKVTPFGQGSNMLYRLRGMTVLLKPFQLVGVSWMVQRETDDGLHKGGLLADVPGFGKTVMSLGAIIGNPPSPELVAQGIKATLVVVPNISILKQWETEIKKHLEEENATSYHYKASTNVLTGDRIKDMNIVLVTYPEIQRGWPNAKKKLEIQEECTTWRKNENDEVVGDFDEEKYYKLLWENTDMIFYMKWYRVIFDEVHSVKNINSQTCVAAQNLQYEIFWGLSGTPLVNAAKELFPYLKLIKWTDVATEAEYKEKYLKDPDGRGRIDALVNLLTYRRTHEDRFLGKRMIELNKAHAGTHWVDLTAEERVVYDFLTELFNIDGAQNGAQLKLRQRQAVSHFFLLEAFFRTDTGVLALEKFIEKVAKVENRKTAYEQIGSWFQRQIPGPTAPEDDEGSWSTTLNPFGKSSFGGKFRLTPLLKILLNTATLKQSKCNICQKEEGDFDDPRKLPDCGHIFCKHCIMSFWAKQQNRRFGSFIPCCPKCNTEYRGSDWTELPRVDVVCSFQPRPTLTTKEGKQRRQKKKTTEVFGEAPERRLGDDFFGTQPAFGDERGGLWSKVVLDNMFGNGSTPTPSAKITAVKEIVLRWIQEDPAHKGIIFTQFVTTGLLTGRMLQLEGIHFVYLTGKNTSAEKLKAIEGFKGNPNIRYLVSSMRCGGQSLNLTCANRVIMCDTWWNRAAEEQAFGRVFRLGQIKTTHNIRILARNTVDEHIDNMHKVKAEAIDHTMQDDGHATQFYSDFEITKVLEPEKWNAWVQQCIDEICAEDGIVREGVPGQESETKAGDVEMDDHLELARTLVDLKQGQAISDKMPPIDLEAGDSAYHQPPANPYGHQNIGWKY